MARAATATLLVLLALGPTRAGGGWVVVLRVVDGDTLVVRYQGWEQKLRLIGVDAPESRVSGKLLAQARRRGVTPRALRRQGRRAASFLRRVLTPGSRVRLEFDPRQPRRDVYGRLLAHLRLADGRLLSALLVRLGLARAYRRYPHRYRRLLLRLESQARAGRRGLWARGRR